MATDNQEQIAKELTLAILSKANISARPEDAAKEVSTIYGIILAGIETASYQTE